MFCNQQNTKHKKTNKKVPFYIYHTLFDQDQNITNLEQDV